MSPLEQAFEQQMAQIVSELRADGWEVVMHPGTDLVWLPASVRSFGPDIAARRGKELLIGEVKSRNSRELAVLTPLAEAIAAVPNVRLEVYWSAMSPASRPVSGCWHTLLSPGLS